MKPPKPRAPRSFVLANTQGVTWENINPRDAKLWERTARYVLAPKRKVKKRGKR